MTLPFTLPDWLPPWAFLLAALPVLLWVLAFLLVPFSVFGVKARLETVESQLDNLSEEIRNLAFRPGIGLPKPRAEDDGFDPLPDFGRLKSGQRQYSEPPAAAPIPPPPVTPLSAARERPAPPRLPPRPPRRAEPRLD